MYMIKSSSKRRQKEKRWITKQFLHLHLKDGLGMEFIRSADAGRSADFIYSYATLRVRHSYIDVIK